MTSHTTEALGSRSWVRVLRSVLLGLGASLSMPAFALCTVSGSATIAFGAFEALASSGNQSANSGSTFVVKCTPNEKPALYSTTPRTLVSGASSLPFSLSIVSPGGPELPSMSPGAPMSFIQDNKDQVFVIHGLVRSADFRGLPSGTYTRVVTLTLEY